MASRCSRVPDAIGRGDLRSAVSAGSETRAEQTLETRAEQTSETRAEQTSETRAEWAPRRADVGDPCRVGSAPSRRRGPAPSGLRAEQADSAAVWRLLAIGPRPSFARTGIPGPR